eukprot:TRINITY_DN57_c6_g1_i1.p1 TRINITY_DN57_c6_g1~~TRINITY_DN57_c6_g1_i1.p1  ORF type:complete len:868 (+),score=212.00 TRINITY_DN57_c6_g1_i1:108-2711(+)
MVVIPKDLTPDAQYMGKVGLPRIVDRLLKRVLAAQPNSPRSVVTEIRDSCNEELAEGKFQPSNEDEFLEAIEKMTPRTRKSEIRKLLRKQRTDGNPAPAPNNTEGETAKFDIIDLDLPTSELYTHISKTISAAYSGRSTQLFLRDVDNNVLYDPSKPEIRTPVASDSAIGRCIEGMKSQYSLKNDLTAADKLLLLDNIHGAVVATPIQQNSEVIAVIVITSDDVTDSSEDIATIEAHALAASRILVASKTASELRSSQNQVDVLLDVARRLASELEVNSLIRTIMQVSRDLLEADRSTLFLVDKETDELWSSVADGTNEIRIPRSAGIAGTVATSGEPLNIPDAYADPRFNQSIDKKTGYRTCSMLCMPMIDRKGEVLGVTQMINKKSGSSFGKNDQRLLAAFSAQAAVAIENSLLFKRTEESKNLFMSVLASIKNLIITLDKNGFILTLNRDPLDFGFGISEEKMRQGPYQEWFQSQNEKRKSIDMKDVRRRSGSRTGTDLFVNGLLRDDIKECYKTGKDRHVSDFTYQRIVPSEEGELIETMTINYTIMALRDFDGNQTGVVISLEDISNEAQMMATLGKYMSPELAAAALEGGTELGGQQLPVSVLFVDIRNFTGLSEALDATEVVQTLNVYFQHMGGSVLDHGGIVDKYIGDAVMAVFGVPFPTDDDAHRVCSCALEMFRLLEEWNAERKANGIQEIRMGIGINSGEVVAGNIGFEKRMEYTVIGDGVNLASRMEGATKEYKTHILITEFTYQYVSDAFYTREVDCIRVVGKKLPVKIYELQGSVADGPQSPKKQKSNQLFHEGLELYKKLQWEDALKVWKEAHESYGDLTALALIPRVQLFLDDPHIAPKPGWDGVWDMASK